MEFLAASKPCAWRHAVFLWEGNPGSGTALMWATEDQQTEACRVAYHGLVTAQWWSLVCWARAALPSCRDCSPVAGGCWPFSRCSSSKIACVWVLLILSLISFLQLLMTLSQDANLQLSCRGRAEFCPGNASKQLGASCTVCCNLPGWGDLGWPPWFLVLCGVQLACYRRQLGGVSTSSVVLISGYRCISQGSMLC